MPGGIRTPNLLIRSQKLYPVELQAQIFKIPKPKFQTPRVRKTRLELGIWNLEPAKPGGRRDSNPQQPEPQSGALPLSYDHHNLSETESKISITLCKQRARLFPLAPLIVSSGGPEISPLPVGCSAAASCNATCGGLACRRIFLPRNDARRRATGRS